MLTCLETWKANGPLSIHVGEHGKSNPCRGNTSRPRSASQRVTESGVAEPRGRLDNVRFARAVEVDVGLVVGQGPLLVHTALL